MGIRVEAPGLLTTVQDEGRFGFQEYGVSPAGAMDQRSFCLSNILVGNRRNEGVLEVTYMGPTLVFQEDNIIAITGGDFTPEIDGQAIPMYRAVKVRKGETLVLKSAVSGCRGYIAFAGGLDIPLVMGSKSTLIRNHMGGYQGRKLEAGDTIGFLSPKTVLSDFEERKLPQDCFPKNEVTLRVITGPQDNEFTEEEMKEFFWHGAEITNEFDRMGCRLKRERPLKHIGDGNIISDGIVFGSIQVPTNGQPIIMLADRQSTGGYTKIGTVIPADLCKLAQSLPGYRVRFIRVGIDFAQQLYVREQKKMDELERKWRKEN